MENINFIREQFEKQSFTLLSTSECVYRRLGTNGEGFTFHNLEIIFYNVPNLLHTITLNSFLVIDEKC